MAFYKNVDEFLNSPFGETFLSDIQDGKWGLFLGAGASVGATNSLGKAIPLGYELIKIISKDFGIDDTGFDLQMITELAKKKDAKKFEKILKTNYLNCNPGWQKLLGSFSWRNIHTTNIDDVLLKIYQSANPFPFQKSNIRVYKERIPISISHTTLQIVFLHGLISKTECELIFTAPDYAKASMSDWFAFHNFAKELLNGRMIFVGTKLKEPDFEHYVQKRIGTEYDEPIYDSIIVDPSITPAIADFFESRKIHCIQQPGEHFFKKLDEKLSKRKPLAKISTTISYDKMSNEEKRAFNSFNDYFNEFPDELASTFTSVYEDFFSGGDLGILDLEVRNDCIFSHIEKAEQLAFGWIADKKTSVQVIYLHGGSGGGKTSTLRRLAFNLSQKIKHVYWHNGLGWPVLTNHLARLMPSRFVIFIDDVQLYDKKLSDLLISFKDAGKHLLVVCGSRDRYESRINSHILPIIPKGLHKVECNWLQDDDLDRLARHLSKKERLGPQLRGKSIDEIKRYFRDETSKILLAAMIKVFEGRSHEEVVVSEYNDLSEFGKKIYRYCALVESRSNRILLTTLSKACSSKDEHVVQRVLGLDVCPEQHELRSVVFAEEVQGLTFLRTRHRIIASTLVKKVISNKEALEIVRSVLDAISPYCNIEGTRKKDPYSRLAKSLMDQHWLADEMQIDSFALTKFFEELQKHWAWSNYYWLQRSTFELHKMRRFDVAWDYCRKSMETGNNSPMCVITYSNICFHWAKSIDTFPGKAYDLFIDATENMEALYKTGYREPVFYVVMIRGLLHIASKFGHLKELESQLDYWIKEANSIANSGKMVNFARIAREVFEGAKARSATKLPIDVSPLDSYQV